MTYRGKLGGGVVVLDLDVRLPDGLEVLVEPVQADRVQIAPTTSPPPMRNGVPVFPRSIHQATPGLDLVNQLRDESL